jgi:hypothetical protein
MSNKYLLVISKDYWGTHTSENIAQNFSNQLSNLLSIPQNHITKLIGNNVSLSAVKETVYSFVHNALLENPIQPHLYIYMNGHGNQTIDANGDEIDNQDELYQLPDGNLVDDELTNILDSAVLGSNAMERPLICLISYHCSSGSLVDKTQLYFDWVSIGSSLDNQDSFVSGDGNVMTFCFMQVLEANKDIIRELTVMNVFSLLQHEMQNSFIGELQIPTLHISNAGLMNYALFN